MFKITSHPILDIPEEDSTLFKYNGVEIKGQNGFTIAAALHQAGFPVHSHSTSGRKRSLECGIGKCGACEMLVDGVTRRICVTKVDGVREVREVPQGFLPNKALVWQTETKIYKTDVLIIGAGPAGLAVREELNRFEINNIVVDSNDKIGGQFNMQTHQFFFFEREKKFGGMRGFDIASTLAGEDNKGIFLNSSVWDIIEGNRVGVKNTVSGEIYYIDCHHLVIATGAVPFMPVFKNDDLPGVYSAAVVQKMMNTELTLLGKNILTVGAGNIGYLTSYQAIQAGANIKAILEAMPFEGGFPVQANRVRRLGIPILTSTILLEAIPNKEGSGISGAVVAECRNFEPILGTEKIIEGIDVINICTGLIPDNQLLKKGNLLFGKNCHGVGDSTRIGEGTSAVLRGKQCAYEIAKMLNIRVNYDDYLQLSKNYIDSQQHPIKILDKPYTPYQERMDKRGFVRLECLYGFACNPCQFACKFGAITKSSTSVVPEIDYSKCIGCMECINQCPGLAIFGYNTRRRDVYLPFEYEAEEGLEVILVDNNGKKVASGIIKKIKKNKNKTSVARIRIIENKDKIDDNTIMEIKGFIIPEQYPKPLEFAPYKKIDNKTFVCHCEDVTLEDLLKQIGDRKTISINELKHTTRLGMGDCRGNRCAPRAKQILRSYGIEIRDEPTPRAPLSLRLSFGEMRNDNKKEVFITHSIKKVKLKSLIAGGGIGGSSLFRYMAEEGFEPLLINYDMGSSWRNIAGGRPAFSNPELADIAEHNHKLFIKLQELGNIDYYPIRYVNLAHNEDSYRGLEKAIQWSDAYMVDPKDFQREISPYFNKDNKDYIGAQITNRCWQATPGKTVDMLREIGKKNGGKITEGGKLIELGKKGKTYHALIRNREGEYIEYITDIFINALGHGAEKFAKQIGIETGLYPVRHQAFITKRLPMLGKEGNILDMLIDRRHYKGFSSTYGQQLNETGQIIGCASPLYDPQESSKDLKVSSLKFLEIVSEIFSNFIPELRRVSFQAVWSGYYVEPRYIVDPELGLFAGMRGHGFMLSQYLAKLYVDKLLGRETPSYFDKLKLSGEGIGETVLK